MRPVRSIVLGLACLATVGTGCEEYYELGPDLCQDYGGFANYDPDLPAGGPGLPMKQVTLDAVCNDGSPAVMYIRPAPAGSPNDDKTIVMLEGGGGCGSSTHCLDRFCGLGDHVFERAGKMSSLGAPAQINPGAGILTAAAWNEFGDYNHVLVHYCTSDDWVGSTGRRIVTSGSWKYFLDMEGEAVVNEVFDRLAGNYGVLLPDSSDDAYEMPDLDDQTLLLFAGGSAGSVGVRHHLDRIADRFTASGVEVRGVLDAALSPAYADFPAPWPATAPFVDYVDLGTNQIEPTYRSMWSADDTALDASCLADAAANGTPDWECMDAQNTLMHHVTTPTFVAADLADFLGLDTYLGWGFFANQYELADATAALFPQLSVGWGWWGRHCRSHVHLESRQFGRTTLLGGTGNTFHDTLFEWVSGSGPGAEVQSDDGAQPWDSSVDCS